MAGGVGGAGSSGGSIFSRLGPKAQENLQKAKEVADKAEQMVGHSSDWRDLCAQFAAQQARKAGVKESPKADPKPPKQKPAEKKATAAKSAAPKEPERFTEIRPLTPERVSKKSPESAGFFSRIWNAFSRALRSLVSCFFPSNPRST